VRARTAVLLFGAAAATGAAAVGAATATLLGTRVDDRLERGYTAMAKAFFTMPLHQEPTAGQRPELVLIKGGPRS
jgi:hypothetical protein